jgi:AmiR/NasT family two-component response regulator
MLCHMKPSPPSPRILTVSDNGTTVTILATAMDDCGFSHTACTLPDRVDACVREAPDLAIVDLPGSQALATEVARALKPHCPFVPVTNGSTAVLREHWRTLGACALLVRPLSLPQVAATVDFALAQMHRQDRLVGALARTQTINQAIGLIAAWHHVDIAEAERRLKARACAQSVALSVVAEEVLAAYAAAPRDMLGAPKPSPRRVPNAPARPGRPREVS